MNWSQIAWNKESERAFESDSNCNVNKESMHAKIFKTIPIAKKRLQAQTCLDSNNTD